MIFIHGIGAFHPENIIDNQFLTDLDIGTTDHWITERVGIKQRRTVLSLDYIKETYNQSALTTGEHIQFTNAETGARAATQALSHANLSAADIGMVIAGGCLPQYSIPAEACMIAQQLGINAPAFDINSACSTFAVQLNFINQCHPDKLPDYILLVIPENLTRCINFKDRRVAVLFGDATCAIIVSTKHKSPLQITHTTINSNPASSTTITAPAGGHFYQDGPAVQRFAIKTSCNLIKELTATCNITQPYYFIGHQANLSMLKSVCKLVNIDDQHHLYNVDQFGNCGAAGAPSVLAQNWQKFQSGNQILLAVVGAGLTWGGLVIEVR
jgi:3-oxoacyl-[acyl-carrier-protein] synthase-3